MRKKASKKSAKSRTSRLMLYNTLGKNLQEFKPLKAKQVGIYSCGPTVYDYPHIGNLRAFVFADLLKRYLKFRGYKVKHVMNITDVDDKLIKKSEGSMARLKEVTSFYERIFFENIDVLNIQRADVYPHATEHINEMVALVKKLLAKKSAYKSDDGIYYSIKKFKNYGKLSCLKIAELKAGASKRVMADEYEKKSVRDFALWKFWKPEDNEISWQTEIGKGRPGWHIECSAMSMKYLGSSFDIHTGGTDLVFPHHENEIAQSEAATGKQFVKYWIHNAHLLVDGKKMSKSMGNFYTVKDLLEKGHRPEEIRFFLISTHYRKELNLTSKALDASKESVKRMSDFLLNSQDKKDSKKIKELTKKSEKRFIEAMDDDLNVPKALAAIFDFIREANKAGAGSKAAEFLLHLDDVLGLNLKSLVAGKKEVPAEIINLIDEREKARKDKDFRLADELRGKIKQKGWWVDDTPQGPKVKRI